MQLGDKVTIKEGRPGRPRTGTIIGATEGDMTIRVRLKDGVEIDVAPGNLKKVVEKTPTVT